MELQHINIKVFVEPDASVDATPFIKLFHSWIQTQAVGGLLIDVADYRHVPSGPGVMLIGHEADYSIDNQGGRWGLLYNRKALEGGSNEDRLASALKLALTGCQLIEQQLEQVAPIKFSRTEFDIVINDRAIVPNTQESLDACSPVLSAFLEKTIGRFELQPALDPRTRFIVSVKAAQAIDFDAVATALTS